MQTQNQEQPQVIYHDESLADHMSGNCHAWRFTALRNCAYPVGNRTVYCTLYIIDRVHQPAEQVFELLTRHAVTPCHLTDVLEDIAAVS